MKGIILAGGRGTRLYPMTQTVSKQLIPVFDKPMIYYSLSTLMFAGIRQILIICDPQELLRFRKALGDGRRWGLEIAYAVQRRPDGLAQAFLIGEEFLAGGPAAMILGDNLFHGNQLPELLQAARASISGATLFSYHVTDPRSFGVVEYGVGDTIVSLEEKPVQPKSNWVATGLYFYDPDVVELSRRLKPSPRGELEITDLNRLYLEQGRLTSRRLGRGTAWMDMGTPAALLEASQYVHALESRQGLKIACPEEVALTMGYIALEQFAELAADAKGSDYGDYLIYVLQMHRAACRP
ncbi:MAG: glucose-1-phosphate thymidylyltransferase RfbA [Reyranella sp.]|nr:glucose-1-phosphate thymidylyltransferase RfbA [Reyranella sp.]